MAYYRNTFLVLCAFLVVSFCLLVWVSLWSDEQEARLAALEAQQRNAETELARVGRVERLDAARVEPLRRFTQAWAPHLKPAPARDLGNFIRNGITTLATRTGLTSEGATVPQDSRTYSAGDRVIRVQQISLNVVSESLPAILTWLGEVEKQFPYGRVEAVSVSGYASRSVQLSLTLLHPVEETPAGKSTLP